MNNLKAISSCALLIFFFAALPAAYGHEQPAPENNIYDSYFEAVKPATEAVSNQLHKFSTSLMRQTLIGQAAEQENEKRQLKRDIQTKKVVRSVRDCIKPNGLIDDEVQMCVNGTREKTW